MSETGMRAGRWLLFLALSVLAATGAGAEDDWAKDSLDFRRLADRNQIKEAVEKAEQLFKTYGKDAAKFQEVAGALAALYRRHKKWDEAVEVYERQRKAFPDNGAVAGAALLASGDTQREAQRWEKALEAYRTAVSKYAQEGPVVAAARLQTGNILRSAQNKAKDAIPEYLEVEKADPKNALVVSNSLLGLGEAYLAVNDPAKSFQAYRRVLEQYQDVQSDRWVTGAAKRNGGRAVLAAQNWKEAVEFFTKFEENDVDFVLRSEMAFNRALAARGGGNRAEALAAFFRAQTLYPTEPAYLYDAQLKSVEILVEDSKLNEALSAAKVLYALASDDNRIVQACTVIADRLRGVDGNLVRANQFLRYQKYGPLGEDGKPGGDDPVNPLEQVPYPGGPERQKAIQDGIGKAGDSAFGARQRALLWILAGNAKEALKEFQNQFARCNEDLIQRAAQEWILIGVKTARGHATGLAPYFDWLNYGPRGREGKEQLSNPFEALK